MTRPIESTILRAASLILVFAVVLCLLFPMGGDSAAMHFALTCCFVLAVALSIFLLRRPRETILLRDALGFAVPLARGPTRMARAPDIVALGTLLI
jgi:hypothetical protein